MQGSEVKPGERVKDVHFTEDTLAFDLMDGSHGVAMFNWADAPATVGVATAAFAAGATPHEIVAMASVATSGGTFSVPVPAHGLRVIVAP